MKKKVRNIKGFAMAELLAISIVILLIFSVLVSNYLPLVAEYENRTEYTNLTANYAAFYVRRAYKTAIEENYGGQVISILDNALDTKGFYTICKNCVASDAFPLLEYGRGENADSRTSAVKEAIDQYGIEEIIITRYKLNVSDTSKKTAKRNYRINDGSLYKYIQYLPNYNNAPHGSENYNTYEAYRLIIKTKDFGFATTQILPDPPTPLTCFTFAKNSTGLTITNYNPTPKECQEYKEDVIVTGAKVTVNTTNAGKVTGFITEIGSNAFNSNNTAVRLNSIELPTSVKTIGSSSIANNNIEKFSFDQNAPGVNSVGSNAFRNNSLAKITIPDRITFGEGAFSNNYELASIEFDYSHGEEQKISKNLFALDPVNSNSFLQRNALTLTIPYNVTTIEEGAFKNIKLVELTFEGVEEEGDSEGGSDDGSTGDDVEPVDDEDDDDDDEDSDPDSSSDGDENEKEEKSMLKTIGNSAFEAECLTSICDLQTDIGAIMITIPNTVETIGKYAFSNIPIDELHIQGTSLTEIGNNAFYVKKGIYEEIETEENEEESEDSETEKELDIPESVRTIGISAFENQLFEKIKINNTTVPLTIGDYAFRNNSAKSLAIATNKVTIGKYAFADGKIKTLTLTSKDLTIGTNSFESNKIKTLTLPSSGSTKIGDYAFYQNTPLKSLTITNAVTKIGDHSFDETGLSGTQSIPSSLPNYSIGTIAFGPKVTKIVVGNESQITGFSWANVLNGGGQYGRAYKVYKCRHSYYCGCSCGCDKEGKNCKSCCYCSYTYTRNYCLDYDRTGDDKRVQSWNSTEGGCDSGDSKIKESDIKIGAPGMHCSK